MKIIFLISLSFIFLFANANSKEIANALKLNAYKYNIDKKFS
ncbi:hypothetical protein [Campylobacter aviculae]|nr:hypothetical protein [Campylobacter aviculae]